MKIIFFMMMGISILNAEFIKSGDIVTDTISGLEWQDDSAGAATVWMDAISYCENLTLDGTGWRLPNINELRSIIDRSKQDPAIVTGFENVGYSNWSSTTVDGLPLNVHVWAVLFNDGIVVTGYKPGGSLARCVRGGQ